MNGQERVRAVIDAINGADVDAFLERTDAEFEWKALERSPLAGTHRGQAEVRAYLEEWFNTFDGMHLDIEELVEVNHHVLAVVRGHGWGKASGVEVTNRFCQLWTVGDGLPTRMREYETREEALAAARA
jgi:ketosteroid isomerase-like protein